MLSLANGFAARSVLVCSTPDRHCHSGRTGTPAKCQGLTLSWHLLSVRRVKLQHFPSVDLVASDRALQPSCARLAPSDQGYGPTQY
jgi:hypothetical protein